MRLGVAGLEIAADRELTRLVPRQIQSGAVPREVLGKPRQLFVDLSSNVNRTRDAKCVPRTGRAAQRPAHLRDTPWGLLKKDWPFAARALPGSGQGRACRAVAATPPESFRPGARQPVRPLMQAARDALQRIADKSNSED